MRFRFSTSTTSIIPYGVCYMFYLCSTDDCSYADTLWCCLFVFYNSAPLVFGPSVRLLSSVCPVLFLSAYFQDRYRLHVIMFDYFVSLNVDM